MSVSIILGLCLSEAVRVLGAQPDDPFQKTERLVTAIQLEMGAPIERRLTGSETHDYPLKLKAGQFFEGCVDRLGVSVDVEVFSPAGQRVAEGDGVWTNRECDMVSHIAKEDGVYRLSVRLLFPNASGGLYRIRLVSLGAPTGTDRHRVLGNKAFASAHRRRFRWGDESRQTIAEFEEAIKQWQAAGDRVREAMTYASLATVYRVLGDLPNSTNYFEKALAIFRAEKQQSQEIETMTDLSYTYAKQGHILRGVMMAKEALEMGRARGDQHGQCRALVLLGGMSNVAGNVRAGQEYARRALPLCRAVAQSLGERIALGLIADGFVYMGEPQQALSFFNQALQIADPAFESHVQGYIRLNLARLKLQTGELQEALAEAERSLEFFRKLGTRNWQAHSRLVLGTIYRALGDDEQAHNSFTQALDLSSAADDLNIKALSLRSLAGVTLKMGRQAEAHRYLEQAAAAFRRKGVPSGDVEAFEQLGRLELLKEKPLAAIDYFERARALSQKQELATYETEALWLLGTAHLAAGHRDLAEESFRQTLNKAKDKRLPDYEIQALGALARLARERGDVGEALTLLESALNLIESSRARIASPDFRVTFFSATQAFYEAYIDALMSQEGQENENGDHSFAALALQAVERARARGLLELLTEARADIRQGIDQALLERERELQHRLSAKAERLWLLGQSGHDSERATAIKAELDALTLEQRDLAAQIRIHSPRYAALRQPQPLTLPEIQKQVLDSETLLLEYALGEKRGFLFAVTQAEIKSFVLPGRREIEQQARQMLTQLEASGRPKTFKSVDEKRLWQRRSQQEYLKIATALSKVLIVPLGDMLDRRRLLIVGDGLLHYLPFAALPETVAGRQQPLVVNHEIVTLPSASTLAVLRRELNGREDARKMVAVLADPVFDEEDSRLTGHYSVGHERQSAAERKASRGEIGEALFRLVDSGAGHSPIIPRLPGTRREAEAILSLVPEGQRKAAFDFDASRATATSAELGEYRYLHFATHGLLNSEHPELSGLILSLVDREGKRQPGILRALDIYNLRLPVELVVLSACRTAIGKASGGEGVMGLTRGFLYAGARRVIASLWVVNDRATAELMRRFYQELLGEKRLAPAAALRAAQVSMWREEKWRAPYYWAAFTLQGEWW